MSKYRSLDSRRKKCIKVERDRETNRELFFKELYKLLR